MARKRGLKSEENPGCVGRPALSDHVRRIERVEVRMRSWEKSVIEEAANTAGVTVSEFIVNQCTTRASLVVRGLITFDGHLACEGKQ